MSRQRTVLFISDNDPEPLRAACASIAAVIVAPPDAADDIDVLTSISPDLLLVDLRKGDRSYFLKIAARIQEFIAAPIVLLIGEEDQDLVPQLLSLQPSGILTEPLSSTQCHAVIELALHNEIKTLALQARVEDLKARLTRRSMPESDGRDGSFGTLLPLAPLTRRESDVLVLFLKGRRVGAIARTCFISAGTVRTHLKSVFRKLNVSSQEELMELFLNSREKAFDHLPMARSADSFVQDSRPN